MDKTGPCPGDRETGSLQAILDLLPLLLFSDSDALCTSLLKNALPRTHELESHSNMNMNPPSPSQFPPPSSPDSDAAPYPYPKVNRKADTSVLLELRRFLYSIPELRNYGPPQDAFNSLGV